jgi:hypothetical protein
MFLKKLKKLPLLPMAGLILVFVCAITLGNCGGDTPTAGNLTPTAEDYDIGSLTKEQGSTAGVSVTAKQGKSPGGITVYYTATGSTNKSTTVPTTEGSYAVTFDVAAAEGWNAAQGLVAGTLVITDPNKQDPVAGDYGIDGLTQTVGSVSAVTVTPKSGKSAGTRTVYYEGTEDTTYTKSETLPSVVGTYAVTFDVAAVTGWNAASGLVAGTLVISDPPKNYMSGNDALDWGNSTTASVLTLGLQPGNDTTEINLNWYSTGAQAGKVAQVRFARGTFTSATQLIPVTGTVAAAGGSTSHKVTVTGLTKGGSYQYAVSSDGDNWSEAYDFKVPAAGAFKFAVIADPQLTTGNIDANSRYPAVGTTTAAGWLETMVKIVSHGVSFIASGGDQVDASNGNETEYNNFFAPPGLRNLPFAPVSGNHDNHLNFNYHYNLPNPQTFENETVATEAGRNYFYLYNNILFVVLNTAPYAPTPGANHTNAFDAAANVARFRTTIQTAKTANAGKYEWLIVQHHKSTASVADHCADRDIESYVKAGFEKVMSDEQVDFVLAGHDHVYARSYPLDGRDNGLVSVPDKSAGISANTYTNPGKPIYLTFTTGSGLKYYAVSPDPTFAYNNTLYVKDNATYPYLGQITEGDGSSQFGSIPYYQGVSGTKYLPVSNLTYVQPYIPSYAICEVNGKTIKFSTYAITTKTGRSTGASEDYDFNENTPYDWVQVTKN